MNLMKKRVIGLLLLGIILVSSLVLAQEQTQTEEQTKTYSGFDRLVDNVKMIFTFGDNKVMLALNIREKELNSAIINTNNGDNDKAEKNLERAKEKLQFVQNKVSKDIAEDVKTNIDKTISKINEAENLPDNFKTYILEEEKTQLTAELVIEGKGQTLTKEMVKDEATGENTIKVQDFVDEETKSMVIDDQIEDIIESGINVVESGENQIDPGVDPNATPKTPVPNDGSICCKKIINGKPQYHWDPEEVCVSPENIAGKVVYNDFCLALGKAIDEEDEIITEGVPKPCAEQGVYDKESCSEIMKKVPVCCKHHIGGEIDYEIKYEWIPGDICVSPDRERVDEGSCSS